MTALLVLGAGGVVSWLLRILFVTLIPARKLPARLRAALASAGPAAMAALLATEFNHVRPAGMAEVVPWLAGAAIAALLAYRFKNLAATVLGGTLAYGIVAAAL